MKKNQNLNISSNIHNSTGYLTGCNKSENDTARNFTYMWNLENKRKIVSFIEQIDGCQKGRCVWSESEKVKVKVAQSCPTFCNSMDCSTPGSSVCGIFQARILERVAISFSRGSSQPRVGTPASCTSGRLYCLSHQGGPCVWSRKGLRGTGLQLHNEV